MFEFEGRVETDSWKVGWEEEERRGGQVGAGRRKGLLLCGVVVVRRSWRNLWWGGEQLF